MLHEYSVIRVKKLIQSANEYDGWKINKHHPQIGDIGTIVNIQQGPDLPIMYVVESLNGSGGETVWISSFFEEEIEVIWHYSE